MAVFLAAAVSFFSEFVPADGGQDCCRARFPATTFALPWRLAVGLYIYTAVRTYIVLEFLFSVRFDFLACELRRGF